ncbi:PDZ domain-containing protein [Anaerobaca lacustris]|uniref:PDZ domain-containing protein n=1 Tax=Anaerobaca lacustris TaxID=3044600 RepID=A0AAW6TZR6_9BACT|nr:PDZ domain-containing protein [Sedimentisphaerales bacterium M17dextr]
MPSDVRRTTLLTVAVLVWTLAGCRTVNRGLTEAVLDGEHARQWHIRYGSQSFYSLGDEGLAKIEFEGLIDRERVRVRYQRGMQGQAECVADVTTRLIEQVELRVGMTITTSTTIDLLRFDEPPQNFDIQLTVEPNEFPLPLFVRAGDESCTSILAQNRSYPYVLMHELVETSLAARAGGRVLPDVGYGWFGLGGSVNNYTRWFRDGLANYAGYLACEILSDEMDCPECPTRVAPLLHTSPLSRLATVRTRLFSWSQSSPSEHEREHYNAALGLFLLIEDRFGQQTIRDILADVATRETVDGRDLRAIASQVIGTDVKQFVADFEFPMIGGVLTPVTRALAANKGLNVAEGLLLEFVEPDGPADRAGLRPDDVIVAAASAPVADTIDFELALLRAGRPASIPLAIWRKDAGTIDVEFPLLYPGKD